jgi:nicotinate-nucleotide pyrophosphorylase (carboxylating)
MSRHPEQLPRIARRLAWEDIDPAWIRRLLEMARAEDLAGEGLRIRPEKPGDATSALLAPGLRGKARVVARKAMVPAGLGIIQPCLDAFGGACRATLRARDGEAVAAGASLAEVEGSVAALLGAERTLLNFLQRLSGVATHTRAHVAALGSSPVRLLDTRKTTPGFRALEKYAVGMGGGWNHRLGLHDRVMVKDNHLAAEGATTGDRLAATVARARKARTDLLVEVEVDRADQIDPVLAAGADIVLLDNFAAAELPAAIAKVKASAWCEVSGGVSLATLPALAALGPDFISCGALTHAAPWADIGLDWE